MEETTPEIRLKTTLEKLFAQAVVVVDTTKMNVQPRKGKTTTGTEEIPIGEAVIIVGVQAEVVEIDEVVDSFKETVTEETFEKLIFQSKPNQSPIQLQTRKTTSRISSDKL